jgi:hypothetical protein
LSFSPFQATILSTNGHGTDNHHLLIHITSFQWIKRMMNRGPMMVIKASLVVMCHTFSKAIEAKNTLKLSFSPFQATILSTNGHGTDNHHLLIHFTSSQWIKRMMDM